ncbi:MAG: ATP-binding protein [Gemmataceae bacterium]
MGKPLAAPFLRQLDSLGDWGLLATDANLTVTSWNGWLQARSGLEEKQVVGRPLFELFPDLEKRGLERYFRQALSGLPVVLSQLLHEYILPLPAPHKIPGRRHMQQTGRIVPLVSEKSIVGTLTLIEDVSERVIHETTLRIRAHEQTALATMARSALSGTDLGGLSREAVAFLCQGEGIECVEILEFQPDHQSWTLLDAFGWEPAPSGHFKASDAPRALTFLTSDIDVAVGDVLTEEDFAADNLLRAHGIASGLAVRIADQHRRLLGLIGIYTREPHSFTDDEVKYVQALSDVLGVAAERKRLERELELRISQLRDADRRKDEFLAMLAHELRNPLAPVRNGIQIFRSRCQDDPVIDRLGEMMTRQISQLTRMIDDLLDVSRIAGGKVLLHKEDSDLRVMVASAVDTVRPVIENRHHELTLSFENEPIFLSVDPTRFIQILGNLINNAAKYTAPGGHIWLTVHREHDEAVISVRDNGIGIRPEMLPHVFELFAQDERALDRSEGGLGIGLTLVKNLVELHDGQVTASSDGRDRGSEFTIRLPAHPLGWRPAEKVEADSCKPLRVRRVLVVDDNVDSADSLAMLLGLDGHIVWTAYDGPSAIHSAKKHHPDTVLLDIGLPRMDGYQVARQLREQHGDNVWLIAMTGYGRDEDRDKTNAAGFNCHLVKPVDPMELKDILGEPR